MHNFDLVDPSKSLSHRLLENCFGKIAPGMSFKTLESVVTGIFRDCSDEARKMKADDDFDAYFAPHSPGLVWHFIREGDLVLTVALALSDKEVQRVDPFFEDLNFKLIVLESLLTNGAISLPEGEWVDDRDEDEPGDGEYSDAYLDRLLERLDVCHEWPLKRQDLATLETLTFDDENQIYHYIHPLFDGESDEFNVMGIEGIEHLTNPKVLFIQSLAQNVSLLPLANHPTLQSVSLSCAIYKDFGALESVPNLKKVIGYFASDIYDEDTYVLKRLAAKGVEVKSLD